MEKSVEYNTPIKIKPEIEDSEFDQTKDLTLTPKRSAHTNELKQPQIFDTPTFKLPDSETKNPILKNSEITKKRRKTQIPALLKPIKSEGSVPLKKRFTIFQRKEDQEYFEHLSKKVTPEEKLSSTKMTSLPMPSETPIGPTFFIPEERLSTIPSTQIPSNYCERIRNKFNCCCPKKKSSYKRQLSRGTSGLLSARRSSTLKTPQNRFGHLEGKEKSLAIREFWKSSIRKITFLNKTIDIFKLINKDFQEKRDMNEKPNVKCLVMPGSKFRLCWDMISIVLLLYISIMTPFYVSFLDEIPATITNIETIISILFFADILLNFFTPYLSHNILIISHKQIAKNYLKTWFILDIIATFPFHLMILGDEGENKNQNELRDRIPRMLTMLKLFKLGRLLQFIQLFMDKIALRYKIRPDSSRRLSYCVGVLFVVHLFTCAWYLQARMSGFAPDTWVIRYGFYDQQLFYKYFVSCFWVCQTLTTVVYGDYQPLTFYERFLCFVLMIFGVAFYSTLFSNMSEREKTLRYKILTLANLASQTKLPPELLAKIRNNIAKKYDDENGPHMVLYRQLLDELSSGLRAELLKYMYKNLIRKIRFFNDKPAEFLWKIIPYLKQTTYDKGETIYKPGAQANHSNILIYFIKEGKVMLETDTKMQITSFAQGSYFGDRELLASDIQGPSRSTLAMAEEKTELLGIDKETFLQALTEFPIVEEEVYKVHKIRDLRLRHISFLGSPQNNMPFRVKKNTVDSLESEMGSNSSSSSSHSSSESSTSSYTSSNNPKKESSSDEQVRKKRASSNLSNAPILKVIPQVENESEAIEIKEANSNKIIPISNKYNQNAQFIRDDSNIFTPRLFLNTETDRESLVKEKDNIFANTTKVEYLEPNINRNSNKLDSNESEIVILNTTNEQKLARSSLKHSRQSFVTFKSSESECFQSKIVPKKQNFILSKPLALPINSVEISLKEKEEIDTTRELISTNQEAINKINLKSTERRISINKKSNRKLRKAQSKYDSLTPKACRKPISRKTEAAPNTDRNLFLSPDDVFSFPMNKMSKLTIRSEKTSQFSPDKLFMNSIASTISKGVETDRNKIMISININHQNKSSRNFIKDLKIELVRAIEIIFSAVLDKTEETRALFLMNNT